MGAARGMVTTNVGRSATSVGEQHRQVACLHQAEAISGPAVAPIPYISSVPLATSTKRS